MQFGSRTNLLEGPPTYSLALFVIVIYSLIEDEWYPRFCQKYGTPRRAGFAPARSDIECLTLERVGNYLGYTTQKQRFERVHQDLVLQ